MKPGKDEWNWARDKRKEPIRNRRDEYLTIGKATELAICRRQRGGASGRRCAFHPNCVCGNEEALSATDTSKAAT